MQKCQHWKMNVHSEWWHKLNIITDWVNIFTMNDSDWNCKGNNVKNILKLNKPIGIYINFYTTFFYCVWKIHGFSWRSLWNGNISVNCFISVLQIRTLFKINYIDHNKFPSRNIFLQNFVVCWLLSLYWYIYSCRYPYNITLYHFLLDF